jgi:transmembrane sensor
MSEDKGLKFNTQISEEAADWVVDFRTGDIDAAGRRAFDTWVRSSPEHLRAFLEISAIWNEGSGLDTRRELDADTLTRRAHAEDNVVSFDSFSAEGPLREGCRSNLQRALSPIVTRPTTLPHRLGIAAAIVISILASGGLVCFQFLRAPIYTTAIGEQRTLTLSDGSTIELNSRSRIRVRFAEHERDIDLLEGQALFHVAKDQSRPFVVASDHARVRAVGTQFDVYRKAEGIVVTVVEGRVAVTTGASDSEASLEGSVGAGPLGRSGLSASGDDSGAAILSAGEQVTLTSHAAPRPAPANVATATAWTQHQLVLDSAPLVEVAEEFNRYSTRRIVVEDSAHPLLLSGVFSTDPEFLMQYLRARSDTTVQESESEIRIVRHE